MTFKSGYTRTQIDYFLMRANSRRLCRDCKVLQSECLTTKHRFLVVDVEIRGAVRRKRTIGIYKVRWWNLNGEKATKVVEKIKIESKWAVDRDVNKMWEEMVDCIQRSAKEVLGVSNGGSGKMRGAWWWGEEVKEKVKAK